MSEQELKPCPFCKDGTPNITHRFIGITIRCSCGAHSEYFNTEEEAINAWNTRPIEDALRQENEQLKAFIEDITTLNDEVFAHAAKKLLGELTK